MFFDWHNIIIYATYIYTRDEIKLLRNCTDYKILNDATLAIIVKVNDQSTSYRFDLPELYAYNIILCMCGH